MKSVNFQYNHKLTPGVFSENKEAVQEFVNLLRNPSLEYVKLFGTILAKEQGIEDMVALRLYLLKTGVRNRGQLLDKVTRIAWGG